MDPQFREHVDEIEKQIDGHLDQHLKLQLAECEDRLEERMKMHFQSLEDVIKSTAQRNTMKLERIERKIDDVKAKLNSRVSVSR